MVGCYDIGEAIPFKSAVATENVSPLALTLAALRNVPSPLPKSTAMTPP